MTWWGSEPFDRCRDYIREIDELLHMSAQGIVHLSRMVPLVEALKRLEEDDDDPQNQEDEELNRTRGLAELAKRELENDFPLLHAHSLVGIWSALENLAEDVLVAFLKNDASLRRSDDVGKIKIILVEYDGLDEEGKCRYLASQIQNSFNFSLKRGIARFDTVFKFVGIVVDIGEDLRRTFFELGCLRNAIVHSAGRVDHKLSQECPWLNLVPGSKIKISHEMYQRYLTSCLNYLVSIINRFAEIKHLYKKNVGSPATLDSEG